MAGMTNDEERRIRTPYDKYKGKYVRINYEPPVHLIGKLVDINPDTATLNPHLWQVNSALTNLVTLYEKEYIFSYGFIRGMHEILDWDGYLKIVLREDRIATRFNLQMKIADLKSKGIQDQKLEEALTKALNELEI